MTATRMEGPIYEPDYIPQSEREARNDRKSPEERMREARKSYIDAHAKIVIERSGWFDLTAYYMIYIGLTWYIAMAGVVGSVLYYPIAESLAAPRKERKALVFNYEIPEDSFILTPVYSSSGCIASTTGLELSSRQPIADPEALAASITTVPQDAFYLNNNGGASWQIMPYKDLGRGEIIYISLQAIIQKQDGRNGKLDYHWDFPACNY